MQKPLALSIAVCVAFAGCNVFEKSPTWDQAVRVSPGDTTHDADPSNAYAAKLHAVLSDRGVEHKVVVYQYSYTTRQHDEAVGTRTAVIYRDDSNPSYPWWLKDDRSNRPFWLPNGDLDKQVSFYIRRKAHVIETKEYPAKAASGKATIAFARPTLKLRPLTKPQPQVAVTRITPVKKAPEPVAPPKPAPVVVKAPEPKKNAPKVVATKPVEKAPVAPAPVTHIKPAPAPTPAPVAKAPAPQRPIVVEPEPLAPITSRNTGTNFWAPPAALESDEQSHLTAPRDEHLEKLFRAKHGTDFNRFSPADRRKMQQLQKGVASAE